MTANSRLPRESEATLIVCSENPQGVVEQIATLTSIEDCLLLPRDSRAIHDLQLDTPDRALHNQKLALRIREMGARHWLTLKGPARATDWGGMERLEIEVPWSPDELTRIMKEFMDSSSKIPGQRQDFEHAPPLEVAASLGLEVVQDRENHRQVRNVVLGGQEGSPVLAELAIDSVRYRFSGQVVRHHEVEIEAKVGNSATVLKTVIESLIAMYSPALRRWDHGKLTTGMAIEALLEEGALEGLLAANGNLKPGAYDRIDEYLRLTL